MSLSEEELHMITKEAIDSSHPAVKVLVDAGYGEAESIVAIEKWETPEKAVGYLIAMQAQNLSLVSAVQNTEEDETLQYVAK